jgi:VIT1/CCC1 family predicted Fe2+/Mn2+ transporter
MSSTDEAPRFQTWIGQASNLDRCTRCGRPRSVHGSDWGCPAGVPHGAAPAFLVAGGALAIGGIIVRLTVALTDHQIAAGVFLAGVVLFVTGLSLLGRPH